MGILNSEFPAGQVGCQPKPSRESTNPVAAWKSWNIGEEEVQLRSPKTTRGPGSFAIRLAAEVNC